MIHFRARDYVSVLLYRLLAGGFGRLGRGARIIWPLRIVGARYCAFGDDSTLQYGAYIAVLPIHSDTPSLRVGNRTQIGDHAHIIVTHDVEIGDSVLIADRLFIADNTHEFSDPTVPIRDQGLRKLPPTRIGDGAWIGENVCITGASIGRNSVVAANSVVNRDVPDCCVVAGAPARIVRRYCTETGQWRRTDAVGEFVE